MKVIVTKKELNDSLSIAASASSKRTALPILSSIRIEAKDSSLHLLGCDGELWAASSCVAKVEEPGSVCVAAQLLTQIVQVLPDTPITLELEGTNVRLTAGGSDWLMLALPAEEFPEVPLFSPDSSLILAAKELRNAIDGVNFAVSADPGRPILTGVQFDYNGSTLTLVATDTHRLAVCRLHREGLGSSLKAVVPDKALKIIKALPLTEDEKITVSFDESRLIVDIGSAMVVCQLLNGIFPNWERVVPGEYTRLWTLDRKEFHDNIRRAMILASDNNNRVRFSGQGEKIVISAKSEEKGEAKEEVAAVAKNGDLDIAFNGKYLMDALAAMGSDGIRAEMTESSRPAVIRPTEGGDDHFCVVMPMAIG
ncbi:MAG: DNA polymerase III subunit beta [Fimbriimonadaceae bacterium]|jgi:DNA polymerase-3 subunit beta|nr:DNA polymerase III subunit beta [Fimbriimonadaceae bacterium]